MERSNFALRLLPSLLKTAQRVAERENCSVNQLINIALAEKLAVLDQDHWEERKKRAAQNASKDALRRIAGNEPPRKGDELPKASAGAASAAGRKILKAGGH
jgi:hypothetical protein